MNPNEGNPIHVFVSYAREDKRWLDPNDKFKLIPFLSESLRWKDVVFWSDADLRIGDEYKKDIDARIDQSQIVILLVSQDLLNSKFIREREMPRIIERAKESKLLVIPILVGKCHLDAYPLLADRQMVPSSTPLIRFIQNEAEWDEIRGEILDHLTDQVERMRRSRGTPPAQHAGNSGRSGDTPKPQLKQAQVLRPKTDAVPMLHKKPWGWYMGFGIGKFKIGVGVLFLVLVAIGIGVSTSYTHRYAVLSQGNVWVDPSTRLMWARKDNGSDVTQPQAVSYCSNLRLDGHSDWHLPTSIEFLGIYDESASNSVKGGIGLSSRWYWSSSMENASGEAWTFSFNDGKRYSHILGFSNGFRALCVRSSGE
jgi:hypothetical protein